MCIRDSPTTAFSSIFILLLEFRNRKRHQRTSNVYKTKTKKPSFCSLAVYGSKVETCEPYSHDYTKSPRRQKENTGAKHPCLILIFMKSILHGNAHLCHCSPVTFHADIIPVSYTHLVRAGAGSEDGDALH